MNTMLRSLSLAAATALALAAATPALAQSQARRVGPEQLSSYWILLNFGSVQADVPNSGQTLTKPGCVAITYEIGTDGKPQEAVIAKVVPKSDLGSSALSLVKRFEYGPSL